MQDTVIRKLDHLVITTADLPACLAFYEQLGFTVQEASGRYELFAGDFKINVHLLGQELSPHAQQVQPGSADLCFEVSSLETMRLQLEKKGVPLLTGVVLRHGVHGEMLSIYLRDPDGNLIEFCQYET